MISTILIYYISYLMSYLGYTIKKDEIVQTELPELRKSLHYATDITLFIIYSMLLYFLSSNLLVLFTTIILIIIKLISYKQKVLKTFHNLTIFASTLIFSIKFLPTEYKIIAILPIFVLFFENTLHKKPINYPIEAYKFVYLTILFILLNIL